MAIAETISMLFFGRSVLQLYLKVIFTSKTLKKNDGKSLSIVLFAQFVTLFFSLGVCQGHICNFVMMPKSVLHRQMMGTTNPANAAPGTIRF